MRKFFFVLALLAVLVLGGIVVLSQFGAITKTTTISYPNMPLQGILGISGSFDVEHWHVGDDIRVSVYDATGNSVYFVTNSHGAEEWIAALSSDSGLHIVRDDRAAAEIIRVGNEYHISSYDVLYPEHQIKSSFSLSQASQIVEAFGS